MPKKSPPLLHKLSNLVIFLKKPMIPKLIIFLKKTRKFKQYNYYDYVREYEFSPSSTPLIDFRRKSKNGRIIFKKMYSNVLLISRCLGVDSHGKKEMYCAEMGMGGKFPCFGVEGGVGRELVAVDSSSEDGDQTVDERAERFIQRFYDDMRRQRLDYSNLQMLEM